MNTEQTSENIYVQVLIFVFKTEQIKQLLVSKILINILI